MSVREFVARVQREKVALGSAFSAVVGFLAVSGIWDPDPKVLGAFLLAVGALFAVLRGFLTPSSEVLVQQKPGEAPKITTDKFGLPKGEQAWIAPADDTKKPKPDKDLAPEEAKPDEKGTMDVLFALVVTVLSTSVGVGLIAGWQVMVAVLALLGLIAYFVVRWARSLRPAPRSLDAEQMVAMILSKDRVGSTPG